MIRNLKAIKKLAGQGVLPFTGEILRTALGLDLRKYYDARYKYRARPPELDVNTLDVQALGCFLSELRNNPKKAVSIESFLADPAIRNWVSATDCRKLGDILRAKGSDKSTTHDYYRVYQPILKLLLRDSARINLTEIGLGTNNLDTLSNMGVLGTPGASARAFRDFSSNINIYGADVDNRILFQEERIQTTYVDQLEPNTINELIQKSHPDILIDDGLHAFRANFNVLNSFISYAKDNADKWLIVEDVHSEEVLIDCWLSILQALEEGLGFKTWAIKTKVCHILAIKS